MAEVVRAQENLFQKMASLPKRNARKRARKNEYKIAIVLDLLAGAAIMAEVVQARENLLQKMASVSKRKTRKRARKKPLKNVKTENRKRPQWRKFTPKVNECFGSLE